MKEQTPWGTVAAFVALATISIYAIFWWAPDTFVPRYKVLRVIDGNTIEIMMDKPTIVRYIGIDVPELPTCQGKASRDHNARLLWHPMVRLEKDTTDTDQYGLLLRYVYTEDGRTGQYDRMVNISMVALGYARPAP